MDRFRGALRRELLIDPDLVRRLAEAAAIAVPFEVALDAELREIGQSRALRGIDPARPGAAVHATRRAADMATLGVALSGGGVRSATFNLGVLQGLAHGDLLRRVDYLSTVSGGGYIGSWLASWSKRVRGGKGVGSVQERLRTEPLTEPDALSVRAVRFLRSLQQLPHAAARRLHRRHVDDDCDLAAQHHAQPGGAGPDAVQHPGRAVGDVGDPVRPHTGDVGDCRHPGALRACSRTLRDLSGRDASATVLLLYASAIAGQQLRRFDFSGAPFSPPDRATRRSHRAACCSRSWRR